MDIPSPTCKSCIYWKDAQKEDGYVNCVGGGWWEGGFPGGSMGKESACNVGDSGDVSSIPGLETPPEGGHEWQSTPVFLPRESHGQRSLSGYSPQGHKELNMTEMTEYAHRHI